VRVERVDEKGKRNFFAGMGEAVAAWKRKVPTKRGATRSADGGRDLSLFNKLVHAITMKKKFVKCRTRHSIYSFQSFQLDFKHFMQNGLKMTTGRHSTSADRQ
jgi:hypothetical protein